MEYNTIEYGVNLLHTECTTQRRYLKLQRNCLRACTTSRSEKWWRETNLWRTDWFKSSLPPRKEPVKKS